MNKFLITVIIVFLFGFSGNAQNSDIQQALTGVKLKEIEKGKLVNFDPLKSSKGKITIIEFWEYWCAPCINSMSHLKGLYEKYPNDLNIICISSDDIEKSKKIISEKKLPFHFVCDKEKKIKEIFPHTGIPHSVVFDKKGMKKANTHPGYLSEKTIQELISGNDINLPEVIVPNTTRSNNNQADSTVLFSFEIRRFQLGEKYRMTTRVTERDVKIIEGHYTENSFYDTKENFYEYGMTGKNILELYMVAYPNFRENRFIFPDSLGYINKHTPNHRYSVDIKSSDLFGNIHSLLRKNLDNSFNLKSSFVEKEVEVLILDSIVIGGNILPVKNIPHTSSSSVNLYDFELETDQISLIDLLSLLESKLKIPVVSKNNLSNLFYQVKLKMHLESTDVNEWIKYFEKEGIILKKGIRKVQFVQVERAN